MDTPRPSIPAVLRRPLGVPSPTSATLGAAPLPAPVPGFAIRALIGLRRGLLALADRVVPAHYVALERSFGVAHTAMLAAVARLAVPDALDEAPATAAALAARVGVDADALHRVLRALASTGFFVLRADGRFENNRLSRALRGGALERTREWAIYFGSQSNVASWADLERTLGDGESAFERVLGASVWEWFERHPDEREMFAQAMMGITTFDAPVLASLYPYAELGVLCDVGGGRGTMLSEILVRHPRLRGVLCDAPGVLESAGELLRVRGVAERVELRPGSFFESIPEGADAYLLKNVLHDWDDTRCRSILKTVRSAMRTGNRLLVAEMLVERNDGRALGALSDVQMMMVCSRGRERSASEIHALMRACGFEPARVFPYPTVSIVEARAV